MARGKMAARAAGRRAVEAQETFRGLQAQLAAERAAWAKERDELRRQIVELQSRLNREVRALADKAVAEARAEGAAALTSEQRRHKALVLAGLDELDKRAPDGIKLRQPDFAEVAEAFGIEVGDWLGQCDKANRQARRTTNASARNKVRIIDELRAQGKHAAPEGRAWVAGLFGGEE